MDEIFFGVMAITLTIAVTAFAFRACQSSDYQSCIEHTKSAAECEKVKP